MDLTINLPGQSGYYGQYLISVVKLLRPDFNRANMIGFQGAKISSDVGFLLVREIVLGIFLGQRGHKKLVGTKASKTDA